MSRPQLRDVLHAGVGPLLGCVVFVVAKIVGLRGLNLWAVWQIENAERFERWLDGGGDAAMREAFRGSPELFPLPGWIAAIVADGDALLPALMTLAAVAAGLTVWAVFETARALRGTAAGVCAAIAMCAIPQFWGFATLPGPSVFSLAAVAVAVCCMVTLRSRPVYAVPVALALALTLLSSFFCWLLCIGSLLCLIAPRMDDEGGWTSGRAISVSWLAVPAAIVVAILLAPGLRGGGVADLLGAWLDRPVEPFLLDGEVWRARRLPLGAPLWLSVAMLPSALSPAVVAGVASLVRTRVGVALFAALVTGWILIAAMGSPFVGGVHLMANVLPLLAVFAGAGAVGVVEMVRNVGTAHRPEAVRSALALSAALVLASMYAESAGTFKAPESFYSGLVGGTRNAVNRGASRYPHGPMPMQMLQDLADAHRADDGEQAGVRVAFLSNAWELGPVVGTATRLGLVSGEFAVVPAHDAEVMILHCDDTVPEYYDVVDDFWRLADGGDVSWLRSRGVPLLGTAWRRGSPVGRAPGTPPHSL